VGWSFVYLGLCRLLQLVALLWRSERSKELEILLLRHELAILRRQPRRPPVRPVDRRFLRRSPGRYRGTLGRAYRCVRQQCCAGTGSWSVGAGGIGTDRRGAPPLDRWAQALVVQLARENPLSATGGSSANCGALASPSRRRRCGRSSSATVCRRAPKRERALLAQLPPPTRGDDARLRFLYGRDRPAEAVLRPLVPLAGEPPGRAR
jgi:hypothetical protein